MRISLTHVVRNVEPELAARWWSDFHDGRDDHGFIPGLRRRVVARAPEGVVMEEELRIFGRRLFRERTTAWPGEREVRFAGRNDLALFDGSYAFDAHPKGTRIALAANVTLVRPFEWADVAAKPLVAAILRVDLAAHAKDMRSELIGRRKNAQREGA